VASRGPRALGETEGSPNPFMAERSRSDLSWRERVYEIDAEAGDLLASALRAERVPHWWDAEAVLQQYAQAWLSYAASARPAERASPDEEAQVISADRSGPDAGELLTQLEECLTRLMLIGHAPTTTYLLPELLAFGSSDAGAPIGELETIRLALSRFHATERVRVGVNAARTVAGGALAKRNRPDQIRGLLGATGGHNRTTTIVLLLAGSPFALRGSPRPPWGGRGEATPRD
jgi:hypothetical protein